MNLNLFSYLLDTVESGTNVGPGKIGNKNKMGLELVLMYTV